MSFSEPSEFTVNVTSADISASSQGETTNSLATALKRLRDNQQLAGVVSQADIDICTVLQAYTNVNYTPTMVVLGQAFVCSTVYALDTQTALKILLENVIGTKPSIAYTATLTHL